jgi:hypothetical protein
VQKLFFSGLNIFTREVIHRPSFWKRQQKPGNNVYKWGKKNPPVSCHQWKKTVRTGFLNGVEIGSLLNEIG